jgi:hypothetical protein
MRRFPSGSPFPNRAPSQCVGGRTFASAALVALAAVLVLTAPFAAASNVVTLVAPFSGTAFATISHYHQGCGKNILAFATFFAPTTGKAHWNQESKATRCASTHNVLSIFQTIIDVGINSTAFSPASSISNAHVKVHWGLTYNWYMVTTLGNASQTTYAFFSVEVLASIYDATTGTTFLPTNSYLNSTTLSDVNASSFQHITKAPAELFFNLSLSSSHSYVYNTSVRVVTTVDTVGPGSSAFSEVLFYDPTLHDAATLNWVTY